MYSISYVPIGGDFSGQDCAYWHSYGEPYEFPDYATAAAFISQQPTCWRHLDMKVVPLRKALEMSAEMVELYSGRRKVQGFLRVIADDSKATYEQVMALLVRSVYPSPDRRLTCDGKRVIQRVSSGNSEPCTSFVAEE